MLALGAVFLLAGTYLWLYRAYTGPTLEHAPLRGAAGQSPPYVLSAEQQQLVDAIGYPESFALLFYQDADDQDQPYDVRFESWHYAAAGRDVVFVNGELISDEVVQAEALLAAPYHPEQFAALMPLEDVLASTGIEDYAHAAADPAFVASGEVFFARQLTFGMKAGRLMAVETVPLEAGG
jgi:hypothetical protein